VTDRPDPPEALRRTLEDLHRQGARLRYVPGFLSPAEADAWLSRLRLEVELDPPERTRIRRPFSRDWVDVPRQQSAYGDPGTCYAFSGTRVEARPWIEPLLTLRERLALYAGWTPNFVLVNRYRSGADCMGWHADDERDLGPEPEILSLTLGGERDFQLRRRDAFPRRGRPASAASSLTLRLGHGSLLVMSHPTNRDFKHQLPRRGGRRPDRIPERWNLTWRRIYAD